MEYKATLNIDRYIAIVNEEIDVSIISMRTMLRSIDEGTCVTGSCVTNSSIANMHYLPIKQSDAVKKKEILKAFNNVIRSFLDFLDIAVAFSLLRGKTINSERPFQTKEEILHFLEEKIDYSIQEIANDRSRNSSAKLRFFSLSSENLEAARNYIALRNDIEHHKGIAKNDLTIYWNVIKLQVEGKDIAIPQRVEAGQIMSIKFENKSRIISSGEAINISEEELDGIVLCIKMKIVPEIIAQHFTK